MGTHMAEPKAKNADLYRQAGFGPPEAFAIKCWLRVQAAANACDDSSCTALHAKLATAAWHEGCTIATNLQRAAAISMTTAC